MSDSAAADQPKAPPPTEEGGLAALGQRLREARVARSMGLREVARALDISPGYLSELEHGGRTPSLDTLQRLAEQYGLVAVDLLDGIPPWGRP